MVGNNLLSGSSSAEFAAWTDMKTFSIEQNPQLDWALQLLGNWTSLEHASMQGCRIGGTLPQEELPENLEVLLLSDNQLSGSLSVGFLVSPSLRTLTLSNGQLSGTLSDAMATSMWNLSAFLANNLRLSGTLPQQHTFYQIVSNISHTCDWITDAEECSIAAASLGIVASLSKSANMSLHPPYCHFDATTNTPGFNSLIHTGNCSSTNQCICRFVLSAGSSGLQQADSALSVAYRNATVLSFSRNFITGTTDALEGVERLQTLILSSNFLSCNGARLDSATNLAEGFFKDPGIEGLQTVGNAIGQSVPYINPFSDLEALNYSNIALVYAGNSQLTTYASSAESVPADNLLNSDRVRAGRHGLFAGRFFSCPHVFECT